MKEEVIEMKKIFRVRGWFKKKGNRMDFTKEIISRSEDRAIERLYSDIGSKHAVKRSLIHVSDVSEIESGEVEDPKVRAILEEE